MLQSEKASEMLKKSTLPKRFKESVILQNSSSEIKQIEMDKKNSNCC